MASMDRIVKLLFATTALWIFSVLITFMFVWSAGNGGEYWGFDGKVGPRSAAGIALERGENRFLAFDLEGEFGQRLSAAPEAMRCDFHLTSRNGHLWFNEIPARHGYDSARLAETFARSYNYELAALLRSEAEGWCEKAGIE